MSNETGKEKNVLGLFCAVCYFCFPCLYYEKSKLEDSMKNCDATKVFNTNPRPAESTDLIQ